MFNHLGAERGKPVVVVADDDPDMRTFVSHVLSEAGYMPHTAMDIPEAMEHLLRPGVAAVVLDMLFVNSGGRSGLDLLRFIRSDALLGSLPVIVLTGFPLNREVVADVEGHHAELWHKPIDPMQLTHRLDQLVSGTQRFLVRTHDGVCVALPATPKALKVEQTSAGVARTA